MEFNGEYLYNKKWNGKGYDKNGNVVYELINGNGKIKEYHLYSDKLLFEGEYLNGKRSGKGKVYSCNGNILFEGEYLNGKRNGKEKEYDINVNGKIVFEGEFLNDKRNGIGKEYDNNGHITFPIPFLLPFLYSPSNINLPL